MKNVIVSLIYLLFPLVTRATIVNYYSKVNEAEQFFINDDFQGALNSYKSAFEEIAMSSVFVQDLHNATLCALKLNDIEKAKKYAKNMVKNGCPIAIFYNSIYKKFPALFEVEILYRKLTI